MLSPFDLFILYRATPKPPWNFTLHKGTQLFLLLERWWWAIFSLENLSRSKIILSATSNDTCRFLSGGPAGPSAYVAFFFLQVGFCMILPNNTVSCRWGPHPFLINQKKKIISQTHFIGLWPIHDVVWVRVDLILELLIIWSRLTHYHLFSS